MTETLKESEYIFQQNNTMNIILLIITIALVITAITNLLVILIGDRYYYTSEGEPQDRRIILIVCTFFSIVLPLTINKTNEKLENIKTHCAFTTGTTMKWNFGEGASDIDYFFNVDGKEYRSSASPTYGGANIPNIKVPNGIYRVIYNKENPNESIMDFKISGDTSIYRTTAYD